MSYVPGSSTCDDDDTLQDGQSVSIKDSLALASQMRSKLGMDILALIKEFEKETGLSVSALDIERIDYGYGNCSYMGVKVTAQL